MFYVAFIRDNSLGPLYNRGTHIEAVRLGVDLIMNDDKSVTEKEATEALSEGNGFFKDDWSVCIGCLEDD
ncbi:MAG: hypothetical protein CMG78_12170 [Marinobacter sp.]|nr:hypothetical protein [Marinobacter sp.]|tara:strand:+ start:747 stop:956 length:210 start_codon:yes stop_codon:yes gene_type:complete